MISSIRNPYIRRGLLIVITPIFLVVFGILGIIGALCEGAAGMRVGYTDVTEGSFSTLRGAWNGR